MDLKLAVRARVPLISVRTRDSLNVADTLRHLLAVEPISLQLLDEKNASKKALEQVAADKVYFYVFRKHVSGDKKVVPNWADLYGALVDTKSTLIVVNYEHDNDAFFDVGELPIPDSLISEVLSEVLGDADKVSAAMRVMNGCTVKETAEAALITIARDGTLTPKGLIETRKGIFQPGNGLFQVYTDQVFYEPPSALADFAAFEGPSFNDPDEDPRLVPRGLLADGPPGTGKTSAAKWLAEKWGVPLLRLDMGATKNKWMGESERNNLANLARIDALAPCIVLMDEVEKTYNNVGDHETGSAMFGQTLWWLAEHQSRVFTFMTTNNKEVLPPELYRPGRIDRTMWFPGMEAGAARQFVRNLYATFGKGTPLTEAAVKEIVAGTQALADKTLQHSALTQSVYTHVKGLKVKGVKP